MDCSASIGVYPRVCGGTPSAPHHAYLPQGLSPRVRGNLLQIVFSISVGRSIPACAGEPTTRQRHDKANRVYPRVCGGTGITNPIYQEAPGLSPRVRGNPRAPGRSLYLPGSIPACAGEPQERALSEAPEPVYPRVCGGTMCSCTPPPTGCGLSPRVRGNRMRSMPEREMLRSIPACAGEPCAAARRRRRAAVYPRVCGGTE